MTQRANETPVMGRHQKSLQWMSLFNEWPKERMTPRWWGGISKDSSMNDPKSDWHPCDGEASKVISMNESLQWLTQRANETSNRCDGKASKVSSDWNRCDGEASKVSSMNDPKSEWNRCRMKPLWWGGIKSLFNEWPKERMKPLWPCDCQGMSGDGPSFECILAYVLPLK